MATRPFSRGWWATEHAGAPRWLIAFALVVFLACGLAVVFNGTANGDEGDGIAVNSPSPSPSEPDSSPSVDPSATAEPSAEPTTTPSASAAPDASPTATPLVQGPPRVAFIGDSYSSGVGASTPSSRWTSVVSTRLGWTEFNVAASGTGYLTSITGDTAVAACGLDTCPRFVDQVPQAVAADPDVVVISGGRNDIDPASSRQNRVANALRTSQAVEGILQEVRTALPDARIIVTSPLWDDEFATASFRAYRESVRAAATGAGATYVDLGEPLAGRTDLVAPDGIHPNDAGYLAIADAFGSPSITAP